MKKVLSEGGSLLKVIRLARIPRPWLEDGCEPKEAVQFFDLTCSQYESAVRLAPFAKFKVVKDEEGGEVSPEMYFLGKLWELAKKIAEFEDLVVGSEDRDGETRKFFRAWVENYGRLREEVGEFWALKGLKTRKRGLEYHDWIMSEIVRDWEADLAGGTAK